MNQYTKRAIATAGASIAAFALPLTPTAAAATTLVLFEHDTVQHQVDLGGPGPGPGDQFVFAGDLFDRPGGMWLGTVSGSCTVLTGNATGRSAGLQRHVQPRRRTDRRPGRVRHRSVICPRRNGFAVNSRWHRDLSERTRHRHHPGTSRCAEPDRRQHRPQPDGRLAPANASPPTFTHIRAFPTPSSASPI